MEVLPKNPLLPLPDNALENIRKVYNLDKPGRMSEAIAIVENWLYKQDHIHNKENYTKEIIERRIIACKGSTEKAKKSLDRLATMKTLLPEFFAKTNVKKHLQEITDLLWLVPLPTVNKEYQRVIFFKLFHKENSESKHFMMAYQLIVNQAVYLHAYDYADGFIIIIDYREINLRNHMAKMNVSQIQQLLSVLIEGYGARLKCIHLLTESKVIEVFVSTMKKFLNEKIGNKLQVTPTLEQLYKSVPRNILPAEYGGNEKSIIELQEIWLNELSSPEHQKYMETMNTVCTDESLRQSCKFNEEYLGMPGSFRSFVLD